MFALKNSALLRDQIEDSLATRFPLALSSRPQPKPAQTPSGIASLDELLHGGFPEGVITELVGVECSGRTTAAAAYLAAVMQEGNVCAWVDVADALDPESLAACGVDLDRLLWVRCGTETQALSAVQPEVCQAAPKPVELSSLPPRHTGGGSAHPRSEGRGMPHAIGELMKAHGGLYDKEVRRKKRMVGTPGAPNRPLTQRSEEREEQVAYDRLPPRRGDNLAIVPRRAEPQLQHAANPSSGERSASPSVLGKPASARKPWPVLDQALRATDLLLQGGGFSSIVLDLGSTPAEAAWRIPLATWFRFRAACQRTRVSLVLLTQHPCARSSAELVVRLQSGRMEADSQVMTGIRYQADVQRSRTEERHARVVPIRKPPQSVRPGAWKSETAWARGR